MFVSDSSPGSNSERTVRQFENRHAARVREAHQPTFREVLSEFEPGEESDFGDVRVDVDVDDLIARSSDLDVRLARSFAGDWNGALVSSSEGAEGTMLTQREDAPRHHVLLREEVFWAA